MSGGGGTVRIRVAGCAVMCPAQIGRVGKLLPSARKSASANLKAEDRRRVGITDPGDDEQADLGEAIRTTRMPSPRWTS